MVILMLTEVFEKLFASEAPSVSNTGLKDTQNMKSFSDEMFWADNQMQNKIEINKLIPFLGKIKDKHNVSLNNVKCSSELSSATKCQ